MNLRYLLVDVDGAGSFGAQPYEQIRQLVGPEGPARVGLHPSTRTAGWVNDVGLLYPQTYPRNVVGSVLLGCLGAAQNPYAGRVVITGWDAHATWRGEIEVRGLAEVQESALAWLLSDIRKVLGCEPGTPATRNPVWMRAVLAAAEHVRSCPTPSVSFTSDPVEVRAMLRRMGGGA